MSAGALATLGVCFRELACQYLVISYTWLSSTLYEHQNKLHYVLEIDYNAACVSYVACVCVWFRVS